VWTQNVMNYNAQIKTMICDVPKSNELWYNTQKGNVAYTHFKV